MTATASTLFSSPRALLLAGLVPLLSCAETPSFTARWDLLDRQGVRTPITGAVQCARAGIHAVRVSAYDTEGLANRRVYPCFDPSFSDPDATIDGPELAPGDYVLEVRGLGNDGVPWIEPGAVEPSEPLSACAAGESGGCRADQLVCDCARLTARADETVELDRFLLAAPPECVDGVDNDADGLVDGRDPACSTGQRDAAESLDVGIVQFRLDLSLFGRNPAVSCAATGLTAVRVRTCLQPNEAGPAPCGEPGLEIGRVGCSVGRSAFLTAILAQGGYTVEAVGLGVEGDDKTVAELFEIDVVPGPGAYFPLAVDFSAEDFLQPVRRSARFSLAFEQGQELEQTRPCAPTIAQGFGGLIIDRVDMELRDAHGGPLPVPLDLSQTCPTTWVTTPELEWGGYSLDVRAYAVDGSLCFASGSSPLVLAPGPDPVQLVVPRLLTAGVPPAGCRDCANDRDCGPNRCVDGLCRP